VYIHRIKIQGLIYMSTAIIRPILKKDNQPIAALIRSVLVEFGVPKIGTAYEDKSLDDLYTYYQTPRAYYFVIEEEGVILGGGGVAQLENFDGNICELQKMYFHPDLRGKGFGKSLIELCLDKAIKFRYEQCYLETMTYMNIAQGIYQKYGFNYIDGPMGDTGHYSCPVHMLKDLKA
jgi:putative acetyltransferase